MIRHFILTHKELLAYIATVTLTAIMAINL